MKWSGERNSKEKKNHVNQQIERDFAANQEWILQEKKQKQSTVWHKPVDYIEVDSVVLTYFSARITLHVKYEFIQTMQGSNRLN